MKNVKSIALAGILVVAFSATALGKSGIIAATKSGTIAATKSGTIAATKTGTIAATKTGTIAATKTDISIQDTFQIALFELLLALF